MTPIILQHCHPVEVWNSEEQDDVCLTLIAGGLPGDGNVVVSSGGGAPPSATAPTGSGGAFVFFGAKKITLHYMKSATGPDEIAVAFLCGSTD